tara:strand:+ start:182 stop:397 length:216 start_codon:yes stop_codon:yes gene_type:complete
MGMSGEQISIDNNTKQSSEKDTTKSSFKNKVDINILLNKVRAEKRKEKTESLIFIGLISTIVVVMGVIVSL